jgi:DNA-directed RNA polymerase subunit L
MSFNSGGLASGSSTNGLEDRHIFVPEGRAERKVLLDLKRLVSPGNHRVSWVGTYAIVDEDHTLGQLLRWALNADKRVISAGYLIPHPLENVMRLHVQTNAATTPQTALDDAIVCSMNQLQGLAAELDRALLAKRFAPPS